MTIIHHDLETTSKCPIDRGAYRYGSDPSTRILLMGVAKDDEAPVVWRFNDPTHPESVRAIQIFRENPDALIYAHNAPFEIPLNHYRMEEDLGLVAPSIERYRCTQAMCRRSGVPESLANAAMFLKVENQKDKRGKVLIGVFADQTKLVKLRLGKGKEGKTMTSYNPILEEEVPWDWTFTLDGEQVSVRDAWAMYIEYCRQDVVVEREIHAKLKKFELTGQVLDGFLFDLRMNHRGVPVDVPSLELALKLVNDYERELSLRFRELTGLEPGQRAKVLVWLKERGYPREDLRAATVQEVTEISECPLSDEGKEGLQIKSLLAFAAVKKIEAMLKWVCPDGRIRGAFTWHGAGKTGRWTSRGPQFQNAKTPPKWMKPHMTVIYDSLGWMDIDDISSLFGNPFEVLACCVRYFVREQEGQIFDVDFKQIEARVLPALIDCERILDKFRSGEDIYLDVAKALGVDRQMGKIISLLCQFGGGWKAVKVPLGDKISEKDARKAVKVYREENPEVKEAWNTFSNCYLEALQNPGKWIQASSKVKFGYSKTAPFPRMCMRLPSGRDIVYPHPKAEPMTMYQIKKSRMVTSTNEDGQEITTIVEEAAEWKSVKGHIEFEDRYFFHTHELYFYGLVKGANYGWVKTYGGDLLQSCFGIGTLVLTIEGLKPIETVTSMDWVWDGEAFVSCGGYVYRGEKPCMKGAGISVTPDHRFMVDNSWVERYKLSDDDIASQSEEFTRETLRKFDSGEIAPAWAAHELAGALRLWNGETHERIRPIESGEDAEEGSLRQDLPLQRIQSPEKPRTGLSPTLLGPRLHACEVLPTEKCKLLPLRGERGDGLRPVAGLPELLRGHESDLPSGLDFGSDRRPRKLRDGQLPVVDPEREFQEQGGDSFHGNSMGPDEDDRSGGKIGNQLHNAALPDTARSSRFGDVPETGPPEPVFDLLNCGPRNRFAVLTSHGLILAHNCTQGTGADFLLHGCVEAERQGYETFAVVHDQALGKAKGKLQGYVDALCTRPTWFPDFPLEADGNEADSYSKD